MAFEIKFKNYETFIRKKQMKMSQHPAVPQKAKMMRMRKEEAEHESPRMRTRRRWNIRTRITWPKAPTIMWTRILMGAMTTIHTEMGLRRREFINKCERSYKAHFHALFIFLVVVVLSITTFSH
jgi:hypothetical protein